LDSAGAVADGWFGVANEVFTVEAVVCVLVEYTDDIENKSVCWNVRGASVGGVWEESDREVGAVESQCRIY
jgi:hypothetical protein